VDPQPVLDLPLASPTLFENGLKEPQPSPDPHIWSLPISRSRSGARAVEPNSFAATPFRGAGRLPKRQNGRAPSPSRPRRSDVRRVSDLIVSLCFDDGLSSHEGVLGVLGDYGLCGSFYVNPSSIGTESHLDWDQLVQIQRAGNEIGGHGMDHLDLTGLPEAEVRRQLRTGREVLSAHGLRQLTFAYPFGASLHLGEIVRECGYAAARRSWGLAAITIPSHRARRAVAVETVPPENAFAIRTVPSVRTDHTVDDLQRVVERAERCGGGWLPFVFHGIGDGRNSYSVSTDLLAGFASWLSARESQGIVVRTVAEIAAPEANAEVRKGLDHEERQFAQTRRQSG
jgi:peptidoglycan/xylan/chitin deacetylase (PgdA/CDA1 family)